ncbi:hypothetical protein [Brumimicrobium aurantiacum]|uniref:DUF1499 domain-containing protein n=1 Tax=Brumimicrobium aurantiacum TaxID=1737063 RepID=A0A3E1EYG4_9FLAO|nr:hypothetical protein [Brumimicrobium aurantiacum]RFC54584.1 hypothetical protein DXU93_06230 [Brumimicrobium aurantiacum]
MNTTLIYLTALFLFIFFWIIVFIKRKYNGIEGLTSRFKASKSLDWELHCSLDCVEEALKNAGFHQVKFYKAENWFYAQSKKNASSWSEEIVVKVRGDHEMSVIYFKSICIFPFRIFDLGKNRRNYFKFERELEKIINKKAAYLNGQAAI